ncbi:hypothetical protein [Hyphococcus sp.]|uniref:hypothetical protein n=1 Tax=Hyphococcus sp. TaxID=2038636 RepID=UPI003CCC1C20
MLLRRITEHVKTQNWTAVALDFVIVVVGVFIGLQGQNWVDENNRRIGEQRYLERLHGEIVQLTQDRRRYLEQRRANNAALYSAMATFFEKGETRALTIGECVAVAESHIYSNATAELPTLTELFSTGRLDTLSSAAVREAALRFAQSAERAEDLISATNSGVLPIPRKYPDLIVVSVEPRTDNPGRTKTVYDCRTTAMRASVAFLNDAADNQDRYQAYVLGAVEPVSAGLANLHAAVDEQLDLQHDITESD